MKLVLHIGTEKTGTTAAQTWFHENTDVMRTQGIWYAQSLGLPNNRALSVISRHGTAREDGFYHFGIYSPEEHTAFKEKTIRAFEQDVAAARAAGARIFLISSEHLHSRLAYQGMVHRAAQVVKPHFDQIEVVCFLRPQVDTAMSLASTETRVGQYTDKRVLKRLSPYNLLFHYVDLIERWSNAFGKKAITLVPFKRNPSTIGYFKKHLGLDPDLDYTPERRLNESLDYRSVALTNHLVGAANWGKERSVHEMARRYYLDALPCEVPLTMSLSDAQERHALFEDMNREIVANWPAITAEDLTPDWSRYPEVGTIEQLQEADVSGVLQDVFARFNGDLALQEARINLLSSREVELQGDLEAAVGFMRAALPPLKHAQMVPSIAEWAAEQEGHYKFRLECILAEIESRKLLEAEMAAQGQSENTDG